jgi:uncharacterized protein (TIGR04222 family)
MHTWGISGPQFLLIYVVVLAATALFVAAAQRRVVAAPGRMGGVPDLDPYEIAYLNGGAALAATTAAANLLRGGFLDKPQGEPQQVYLIPVRPPRPSAHPVERTVFEQIAAHPDQPFARLQTALDDAPALAAIHARLRERGLATTRAQAFQHLAQVLWFVPLLLIGAARVAAGVARGRPVGFLLLLMGATVVLAAEMGLRVPRLTRLGKRALELLRSETPAPEVATVGVGGLAPAQLGLAMALFGAGVLWTADADLATALKVPRETGSANPSTAGGCGGGGGGDGGGGGGCGGGGCGG